MTNIDRRKAWLMLAGATSALLCAAPAMAQEGSTVDEIIVTARKRAENLQTVPLAVTAQTGRQLERLRVTETTELTRVTPSLQIRNSSGSQNSAQIALRGQRSAGALLGQSQPVGLYQDNVNIPHPFGANNSFFDLERTEVLAGPQGTLYGRNTTGGAINVITKSADHSGFHGYVEGEVARFDSYRFDAIANVPVVSDVLAMRLAYRYWTRDGYGKSLVTGQTYGGDKNDHLARLGIKYDPTDTFSADLKIEYGRTRQNGAMLANIYLAPPVQATSGAEVGALAFVPPNSAYLTAALGTNWRTNAPLFRNALFGSATAFNQVLAAGQAALAGCIGQSIFVNCSDSDQFDNLTTWHGSLDVNWDITDHIRLRSITGLRYFSNTKIFDLDSIQGQLLQTGFGIGGFQPAPAMGGNWNLPYKLKTDQKSEQWSQEFNISGDLWDDRLKWLFGVYGSWDDGRGGQQAGALIELVGLTGQLADGLVFGEPGDNGALGSPPLFGPDGLKNTTNTWAVYTQNDFKLTDQFSVTLGARYTEERIGQNLSSWDYVAPTRSYICNGATPAGIPVKFPAPVAGDRDSCYQDARVFGPDGAFSRGYFNGWSYLASANYQVTPDHLIYAKLSRGFRGGAFGLSAQRAAAPEFARDIELGFKGEFLERRLRTNVAVYQTKYTDYQVTSLACLSGLPPPCGASGFTTRLSNAAKAEMKGFELVVQAQPMEGLSLWGNVSYNDSKYTDFPNAVSTDGRFLGNAAGEKIPNIPPWQWSVGARHESDVGSGTLGLQASLYHRGKTPLSGVNNFALLPDDIERRADRAVALVNAQIDYNLEDSGLEFAIWGKNLLNKKYGYLGLSPSFTGGIGHLVVEAPRTYGVTVRKTFGQK